MDLYRLALQGWMRSHSNSGSDSTMTLRAQLVLSMFSQFFDSDLTASRIPRVVQPISVLGVQDAHVEGRKCFRHILIGAFVVTQAQLWR